MCNPNAITCIAVRRAFVHTSVYPAFCDALRGLAAGAPASTGEWEKALLAALDGAA